MNPPLRVSIVIPVHNEADTITGCLQRIQRHLTIPHEVLIVHDTADDTTIPPARQAAIGHRHIRILHNTYGPGPANAIRYGIDNANAPVTVVTMADGSDDTRQIEELTQLVERGVVIAAASRYMPGGQQVGGPRLKRTLSRLAGKSLHLLARTGTRDATNSFKAYDTQFIRTVGIQSRTGFEIGLELTAKATRCRLPVAEIPTIWLDRQLGDSHFDLAGFLPHYLRWWRHAFGPRRTPTSYQPPPTSDTTTNDPAERSTSNSNPDHTTAHQPPPDQSHSTPPEPATRTTNNNATNNNASSGGELDHQRS